MAAAFSRFASEGWSGFGRLPGAPFALSVNDSRPCLIESPDDGTARELPVAVRPAIFLVPNASGYPHLSRFHRDAEYCLIASSVRRLLLDGIGSTQAVCASISPLGVQGEAA